MPSDRNETCPTCGSNKRHVFIGPPCILSPDDTYDPWHDSEPDGWVHDGTCCTNAAGMPNCFDAAPTPAPRETPTDGEWVPAAQRERERAVIEAARRVATLWNECDVDAFVLSMDAPIGVLYRALAALRRGERKED